MTYFNCNCGKVSDILSSDVLERLSSAKVGLNPSKEYPSLHALHNVVHESNRTQDSPLYRFRVLHDMFLDEVLGREVVDGGWLKTVPLNGREDEVLDASFLGSIKHDFTLPFFCRCSGARRSSDKEDTINIAGSSENAFWGLLIALDESDTLALEFLCRGRVGVSSESEELE